MSTVQDQAREVSIKFAKAAIDLIERGMKPDICARKLVAAALVICPHEVDVEDAAALQLLQAQKMIEELQRDLSEVRGMLSQALTHAPAEIHTAETMSP
jgi:hypothetical protein